MLKHDIHFNTECWRESDSIIGAKYDITSEKPTLEVYSTLTWSTCNVERSLGVTSTQRRSKGSDITRQAAEDGVILRIDGPQATKALLTQPECSDKTTNKALVQGP